MPTNIVKMFGIGTQEILLILVVALVLFGGRRLPEIARGVGRGMGEFRRAVRDVQREIDLDLMKKPPDPPKSNTAEARKDVASKPKREVPSDRPPDAGP